MTILLRFVKLVLALAAIWLGAPALAADLVVRNVTLVDPEAGTARLVTIEIEHGRIRSIIAGRAAGSRAEREIDATGLFAIPGLWDAHAHLAEVSADPDALRALVRHGVLGVRDAGSRLETLREWQRATAAAELVGPAIVAAGPTLNGPGDDSLHIEVTDRASAIAAVESLAGQGVRWVKVHRLIAPELLPVITAEAHARGLRVFGHIPRGMSPLAACEAGMDGIEHVGSVLESIVSVRQGGAEALPAAVAELGAAETDDFIRCLAERGVAFTPTLSIYRHLAGDDPERRAMAERLAGALLPFVLRLHRAGVRILIGSDAPLDGAVPWGSALHEELALLERAGIPPADLLRLATTGSAAYLGGRNPAILAGAPADLVLLRADPRVATANLAAIAYVIAAGRLLRPE